MRVDEFVDERLDDATSVIVFGDGGAAGRSALILDGGPDTLSAATGETLETAR